MKLTAISPLYPEKKGFFLKRSDIGNETIFCHFLTPVTAQLKGREIRIQPGGCVLWDVHALQQFSSPDCNLLHNWFHSDASIHGMMKKYGLEFEVVYYPADSNEITRIFQQLSIENVGHSDFYLQAMDALAESLFIALARSPKTKKVISPINSEQKELFLQARTHIHMNITEQWTVEKMATLVNLSSSRFFSLYQKFFGISPQKDLIQRRIQAAQVLLSRENFPVSKVAELTGYTNQYHFIRQFRQITGYTPGAYREK